MSSPLRARLVQDLFQRECVAAASGAGAGWDHSPAMRVLLELLGTAEPIPQFRDHLAALVRQRLIEQTFGGECGDAVIDPHYRPPLEREVEIVVNVLRQVNQHAAAADEQSKAAIVAPAS